MKITARFSSAYPAQPGSGTAGPNVEARLVMNQPMRLRRRSDDDVPSHPEIRLGRLRLLPAARKLFCGDQPVDLGARTLDLLTALLIRRGTLVSKSDLVKHVWPEGLVEDSRLRLQMARLRKALGEDGCLVKTIAGRGYLLAAELPADASDSGAR